jgi:hypothetical protein
MTARRCRACGDACHDRAPQCAKCTAWADLAAAFRFGAAGLDEPRLRAARRYFARERTRHAEPIDSRFARLTRRIADLEMAVGLIADREYVANLEACR